MKMNDLDLQVLKEAIETLQDKPGDYTAEAAHMLQKVISSQED